MRIAFFGGTFDPPHNGHLAVALAAIQRFALDRVLLAPVGSQPLKPQGTQASFADRLAMIGLLAKADPHLEASALDAPRADHQPNFTVDTLANLRASLQPADTLFNIVGIDAFADLPRWRDPIRLLELSQWIVVSRPGLELQSVIESVVPAAFRSQIHELSSVHEEASSTELRRRLHAHEPCHGMLPDEVLAYIHHQHLYS